MCFSSALRDDQMNLKNDFPFALKTLMGLLVGACCLMSLAAWSQEGNFPSRPIRMIVPVPPGGTVDIVTRVVAQKMTEITGQSVVIDNRGGASTIIGTEIVARAPADGYTLLSNTLPLVVNPSLFGKLPFDVEKDLAPVCLVAAAPFVMVAHPSVPVKSVDELVALAKSKPGTLKYASSGSGTNLHVAAELFKMLTGTDLVHVPYRGGGPALVALLGGEAQVSFLSLIAAAPHIKAGKMRGLGITTLKRSPVMPDLPPLAESGVPGYEFSSWVGVLAPGKTPARIIASLNASILKALRLPGVSERFAAEGAETIASSPEQFRDHLKTELKRWAKVVKDTGMRAD
jgi:tripartite-type tricarboxylate transporter receptor subunit TctC